MIAAITIIKIIPGIIPTMPKVAGYVGMQFVIVSINGTKRRGYNTFH